MQIPYKKGPFIYQIDYEKLIGIQSNTNTDEKRDLPKVMKKVDSKNKAKIFPKARRGV